jgi:hypothetical protein
MVPIDLSTARELLEGLIAASSILGGGMAYTSGFRAAQAIAQDASPEVVAHSINEGLASAYETFSPLSILALVVMLWS